MIEALKRRKDWRARFEAAMDEIMSRPFEWGVHDCGPSLAGRRVLAVTGVDFSAQYVGHYDDALSAARLIREAGFSSLGEMVASLLPEIHPSQARIGDLVAIATDSAVGHGLGVVNGERVFVLTPKGIGTVGLLSASMAFKVGE